MFFFEFRQPNPGSEAAVVQVLILYIVLFSRTTRWSRPNVAFTGFGWFGTFYPFLALEGQSCYVAPGHLITRAVPPEDWRCSFFKSSFRRPKLHLSFDWWFKITLSIFLWNDRKKDLHVSAYITTNNLLLWYDSGLFTLPNWGPTRELLAATEHSRQPCWTALTCINPTFFAEPCRGYHPWVLCCFHCTPIEIGQESWLVTPSFCSCMTQSPQPDRFHCIGSLMMNY